jgi:hypothetical protein
VGVLQQVRRTLGGEPIGKRRSVLHIGFIPDAGNRRWQSLSCCLRPRGTVA